MWERFEGEGGGIVEDVEEMVGGLEGREGGDDG